jgi:UDP-N-acetyl-D-glucosamine dehydrogenase
MEVGKMSKTVIKASFKKKSKTVLINSFKSKDAIIGVIGLGYVGLPLIIRFHQEGFKIVGFDVDVEKIKMLNGGKSYIKHIKEGDIAAMADSGFTATTDYSEISNVDAILICVPTPLGVHNEPDLSYIRGTLDSIKPYLKENQLLVLESTTYPGTTEEEILPVIESIPSNSKNNIKNKTSKFAFGINFYVGYSPEREDPGNKNFSTKTIPKVVSGVTDNCLELTKTLYEQIVDEIVPVSSPKVAEMTKILENIHRAVNIGLVNELKMVADKMDIDINEVIDAAATKPFGFTPYYPGPGLGGHCLPIDPFYLTWKAKEIGMNTRFIELAGEINTAMPAYVGQKVGEVLNDIGSSVNGSKILILGLAYKKNVDDTRESPSLAIIDMLIKLGAQVQYSDPFIPFTPKTRKYCFDLKSIELTPKNIKSFDLIILSTDHDAFDYKLIAKEAKLIVDTRGKFRNSNNAFS